MHTPTPGVASPAATPETPPAPLLAHPSRRTPHCVDCAHHRVRTADEARTSFCEHPGTPVDPVTGLSVITAQVMRLSFHLDSRREGLPECGIDGELFEAKTEPATWRPPYSRNFVPTDDPASDEISASTATTAASV